MVVIKGLTMPKYCYECPCKIQCKLIDSIDIERPADCPLEEINEPAQHSNKATPNSDGDRLISKDEFFHILQREYLDKEIDEVGQEVYNAAVHINCLLYAVPFADAKYIKHGRWIRVEDPRYATDREGGLEGAGVSYHCSECGHVGWGSENYCPICGAKMDGE